jgi:glycosyl transferase family 2
VALTLVLLNYRRRKNVGHILTMVGCQSIRPRVVLWNNSPDPFEDARVDQCVNATNNAMCWPRWQAAAQADTEFVAVLDDDLCFQSATFIERLLRFMAEQPVSVAAVGLEGVILSGTSYYPEYGGRVARPQRPANYHGTTHIAGASVDTRVDILKGRFMAMRAELLRHIPGAPPHGDVCDDIVISAHLNRPGKTLLIPGWLGHEFIDLPDKNGAMALSQRIDAQARRQAATEHYFARLAKRAAVGARHEA